MERSEMSTNDIVSNLNTINNVMQPINQNHTNTSNNVDQSITYNYSNSVDTSYLDSVSILTLSHTNAIIALESITTNNEKTLESITTNNEKALDQVVSNINNLTNENTDIIFEKIKTTADVLISEVTNDFLIKVNNVVNNLQELDTVTINNLTNKNNIILDHIKEVTTNIPKIITQVVEKKSWLFTDTLLTQIDLVNLDAVQNSTNLHDSITEKFLNNSNLFIETVAKNSKNVVELNNTLNTIALNTNSIHTNLLCSADNTNIFLKNEISFLKNEINTSFENLNRFFINQNETNMVDLGTHIETLQQIDTHLDHFHDRLSVFETNQNMNKHVDIISNGSIDIELNQIAINLIQGSGDLIQGSGDLLVISNIEAQQQDSLSILYELAFSYPIIIFSFSSLISGGLYSYFKYFKK